MTLAEYLSQNEIKPSVFAAALGVAPSTVTRWIKGERRPELDLIVRIQETTAGKVSATDFLTEVAA